MATASAPPLPPAGIIDLSQVPHLPVLVPPTPGTAYIPAAQHFGSRLSSSPLSPGSARPAPPRPGWGAGGRPGAPRLSPQASGFQEAPPT